MGRRVKISTRIPILATRMRARLAKKIERMIAIGHLQLSRKWKKSLISWCNCIFFELIANFCWDEMLSRTFKWWLCSLLYILSIITLSMILDSTLKTRNWLVLKCFEFEPAWSVANQKFLDCPIRSFHGCNQIFTSVPNPELILIMSFFDRCANWFAVPSA